MKNDFILTFYILSIVLPQRLCSQADSVAINNIQKTQQEILKLLKSEKENASSGDDKFQLTYNKGDVPVYYKRKGDDSMPGMTFHVTRITGIIREGFMANITAYGEIKLQGNDGTGKLLGINFYYNTPVSVRQIQTEKTKRRLFVNLQNQDARDIGLSKDCFILLKDILIVPDSGQMGKAYLPANANIDLKPNPPNKSNTTGIKDSIDLEKTHFVFHRSANELFKGSLYTDAFGLFGKKSNGLIQTELYSSFRTHVHSIGNTGLILANYMRGKVIFRRFDDKFQTYFYNCKIDTPCPACNNGFNQTYLYQRSYLTVDLTLALFTYYFKGRYINSEHLMYLDVGYAGDLIRTGLMTAKKDTSGAVTSQDTSYREIYLHSPYLNLGFYFNFQRNVIVQFNTYWFFQRFGNKSCCSDTTTGYQNIDDDKVNHFFKAEASISWTPMGGANSIFARGNIVMHIGKNDQGDKKSFKELFYQLQLGYSVDFSQLISQAAEKNKK